MIIAETQDLVATFAKGNGGEHDWTYKGLDPSLSAQEIKEACGLLTHLDIFAQDGVKLFDSVVTAKVLTHTETLIFDPTHETKGVPYRKKPVTEPTCEEVRCFEVTDEPKETLQSQSMEKVRLMTPALPLLDTAKQPHERRFNKLANVENTKPSVKVEKETFPQIKIENHTIEKQRQDTSQPTSTAQPQEQPSSTPDNRKKGWLQRLFRKESRNKEDPPESS